MLKILLVERFLIDRSISTKASIEILVERSLVDINISTTASMLKTSQVDRLLFDINQLKTLWKGSSFIEIYPLLLARWKPVKWTGCYLISTNAILKTLWKGPYHRNISTKLTNASVLKQWKWKVNICYLNSCYNTESVLFV